MRQKIKTLLKLTAVFLCLALLLPFAVACGEKEDTASAGDSAANETVAGGGENNANDGNEATPEPTDPPTDPPPTDPPPTEAPTEPIDPNLPYYAYLDEEFKRFGFVNGDPILAASEEEVMNLVREKACTRTAVDVSGDGVPFNFAYRYEVTELAVNFWETAAEFNFDADKKLAEGDIIAGCVYVRDAKGPNPAQVYLAIKTPTNDWNGEGVMNHHHYLPEDLNDGWNKIYFYGESMCDEDPASTALFEFFLGYEPHTIDIGGLYIMRYPGTSENVKATAKMPY